MIRGFFIPVFSGLLKIRLSALLVWGVLIVFAVTGLGCIPGLKATKTDNWKKIKVDLTEKEVIELVGKPGLIAPHGEGKLIYYYPTSKSANCAKDRESCTPIVFEKGRVIGVGRLAVQSAPKKARTTKPRPTTPKPASTPTPAPKPEKPRLDKSTQKEIARLDQFVRQLPAENTLDNLRVYKYLLKLDPENTKYQQKVALYGERFQKEKGKREALRLYREEIRKLQNRDLKVFQGNEQILMAMKILGGGKFYVWLKNTGMDTIQIRPDQFLLLDEAGHKFDCYRCLDMQTDLIAGGQVEGRITFDAYTDPRELVFSHPLAGKVVRRIPQY